MTTRLCILLLALFIAGAAQAQIPQPALAVESGFWWNPQQPGRGYAIEIQNSIVFMAVYVYAEDDLPEAGAPRWYTSSGDLLAFESVTELVLSEEGQCLGCPFQEPMHTFTGRGVTLRFDSANTGLLIIDGEQIPIERFVYSPALAGSLPALLGQWKIVVDYSELDDSQYPYEADILVLDELSEDGLVASGERPGTGASVTARIEAGVIVIRVEESDERHLVYRVLPADLGTSRFRATAERTEPGAAPQGLGYPADAFRTADRDFVIEQLPILRR